MKITHAGRLVAVTAMGALLGCMGGSGGTDGGSAKNPGYRDDVFVSDDTTTGSLSLTVVDDQLGVGDTSGFRVQVRNAAGEPVPNMFVVCDSEDGIAIIEPTTGRELTDSSGSMSGRIGCERPGSFQMVCRLTVGANRRKFAGVRCSGDGSQDFPGSGGGGLGGGVDVDDSGAQITSVSLHESSSAGAISQVDVSQDSDCDNDNSSPADIEPFYDTYAKISVKNSFSEAIVFSSVSFSVSNIDGQGSDYSSERIGVTAVAAAGETVEITAPIFKAFGGSKWAGDPSTDGIEVASVGFRAVRLTATGQTTSGKEIELTSSTTASFGDFNLCGGG